MKSQKNCNLTASVFFIILFALCIANVYAETYVMDQEEVSLKDGTKNLIVILCIDGYKYAQTITYDYNGKATNISMVQMMEKFTTGSKPASCHKSYNTN